VVKTRGVQRHPQETQNASRKSSGNKNKEVRGTKYVNVYVSNALKLPKNIFNSKIFHGGDTPDPR